MSALRLLQRKLPPQVSGIVHLGVSDHSLTYAIRTLNSIPNKESKGCVEIRNFKKFGAQSFLNDLYNDPLGRTK